MIVFHSLVLLVNNCKNEDDTKMYKEKLSQIVKEDFVNGRMTYEKQVRADQ